MMVFNLSQIVENKYSFMEGFVVRKFGVNLYSWYSFVFFLYFKIDFFFKNFLIIFNLFEL